MTEEEKPQPAIMDHLIAQRPRRASRVNPRYTKMVRSLRLAFPLIALALTAVVFTWNSNRDVAIITEQNNNAIQNTVGKNELLNPRFENTDEKGQAYTLTATRAVQDTKDDKVVLLEQPKGDMKMENGHWIAIQSKEGAFEQTQRRLFLRGEVLMFHDGGYQLATPELHIDALKSIAWSDKDVRGQGPEGTLEAKGLEGNTVTGLLVFKGPAKLTLNTETLGDKKSGGLFR